MKQLTRNIKAAISIILVITIVFAAGLFYQMHQSQTTLLSVAGENRSALRQQYAQAGTIYSSDGEALASSESGDREYSADPNIQMGTMHIVGDYTHHMGNNIETNYQNELLGRNRNIIEQMILDFSGQGLSGDDVHLTISADLSSYAYQQLGDYNGAIVVLNYKTGDILAAVSTPAAPMQNVIDYTDLPDTSLFNRALSGAYAPGSTWKIMTTAAWLNSSAYDPNFSIESDGSPVRKNGASDIDSKVMSGTYDLGRALTESSNVFYGELAVKMGQQEFYNYIKSTGLGTTTSVDKIFLKPAKFDNSAASADDALLSWFGTGQPVGDLVLTISPLELCMLTSAVANGGKLMQPHVVDHINNPLGQNSYESQEKVIKQMFDFNTSAKIKELMVEAVTADNTIQPAAQTSISIGGKSGTVQVEGGEVGQNSLWTGFVNDPNYPYAVAVVVEDALYTNDTAIAMGAAVLSRAVNNTIVR